MTHLEEWHDEESLPNPSKGGAKKIKIDLEINSRGVEYLKPRDLSRGAMKKQLFGATGWIIENEKLHALELRIGCLK